ncbi:MAG: DUF1858 domain-containing protein [bacterium]
MSNNINGQMSLTEVIQKYPDTVKILQKHNLHCLGCILAAGESLEDGLRAHGLNVEQVIAEMNEEVNKKSEVSE